MIKDKCSVQAREIDRMLLGTVNKILIDLEESTEIQPYRAHIRDRRASIELLFRDFDNITFNVDRKKDLLPRKRMKDEKHIHEHQLDRAIKKRLSFELEKYYQRILASNINGQSGILVQLIDRKIRLEDVFEYFYLYSEYLEDIDLEI